MEQGGSSSSVGSSVGSIWKSWTFKWPSLASVMSETSPFCVNCAEDEKNKLKPYLEAGLEGIAHFTNFLNSNENEREKINLFFSFFEKKNIREICNISIRFESAKKRLEKMEEKFKEGFVI